MRIKITENPQTKERVEKMTFFRIAGASLRNISSRENPVIKVKYAGIRGSTQGDRKESSPAKNAAEYEMVSSNIKFNITMNFI
jgi:hypothetical protein